jgi:hypothetical protein
LRARIPSPVAGTVLAQGDVREGWLYLVQPSDPESWQGNLLTGNAAGLWMLRELEWLQLALTPAGREPALADGGLPVGDLVNACPAADWDAIWAELWLEA